jgi:hypothetical protein
MPYSLVTAIEEPGVGNIEVAHEFRKVSQRGFYQQMKIVGH